MADEATKTNRLAAGTAALAANSRRGGDSVHSDREGSKRKDGLGEHGWTVGGGGRGVQRRSATARRLEDECCRLLFVFAWSLYSSQPQSDPEFPSHRAAQFDCSFRSLVQHVGNVHIRQSPAHWHTGERPWKQLQRVPPRKAPRTEYRAPPRAANRNGLGKSLRENSPQAQCVARGPSAAE